MATLEVNDGYLYYEIAGSGDPLVLIHGFAADSRLWNPQFETFAKTWCVVRYDMRGHGRSSLPTEASYSHFDDLRALLDHLAIDRTSLVGQSMGGQVAIDFALTYPERVRALVVVDSVFSGYAWSQEWDESWTSIAPAIAQGDPATYLPLLLAHPVFANAVRDPVAKMALEEVFTDYSGYHYRTADPQVSLDPPAADRLGELSAPVLVIVGADEPRDLQVMADTLQRDVPNARRVDLPGVGHVAPLESPADFNQLALDFLQQAPP